MSQTEVYRILVELDGRATQQEISKLLFERFPALSFHTYLSRTLKRMERQGYIRRESQNVWSIVPENRPAWASAFVDTDAEKKQQLQA